MFSFAAWKEGKVAPSTVEVPVLGPKEPDAARAPRQGKDPG
jgi:hypothetical protein